MHPDATDSSSTGFSPAPAAGTGGHPAPGCAGGQQPELLENAQAAAAAAPRGPGGGCWGVPVAVAAFAAVALSFLGPGCWEAAGGAGPCTVLLRLSLYLSCAAAAFLLGTLFALVGWSPRASPPDFVGAWSRLAAAPGCPLRVSTPLGCLTRPRPRPVRPLPVRASGSARPRGPRRALLARPGPLLVAGNPRGTGEVCGPTRGGSRLRGFGGDAGH